MKDNKKSSTVLGYVIVPGLLILVIAVVLNFFVYKLELNLFSNIYNNEVAGEVSLISRRFQSALTAAETTAAFFESSQEVTQEEFDAFASVLTEDIASGAITLPTMIEWVDSQNIIRLAYPVDEKSKGVIGLDMNKYPNRLIPIIKAKETKSAVVSEPIMFVEGYPGLLIYSPIYKNDEYAGQIIVAVRMADLLAHIPGENPIYRKDIYIQTGNFTIPFDDDVIFNNNGERIIDAEGNTAKDPLYEEEYSSNKKGVVGQNIVFADKTWQLKFSPVYIGEVHKRVAAYAGSSLITALVFIYFLWTLQKRREKLAEEKAKTEALIHSVGEGIIAVDENGIITFANEKAEQLSGFSIKEAIGKKYYDFWRLIDSKGVILPQEERPFRQAIDCQRRRRGCSQGGKIQTRCHSVRFNFAQKGGIGGVRNLKEQFRTETDASYCFV